MLSSAVRNRRSFHRGKTVVISCLAAMLFAAAPASATVITAVPSATSVTVGGTFSVDFVIADVADLYAFQFALGFNPDVLSFVRATEGAFLSDWAATQTDPVTGEAGTALFLEGFFNPEEPIVRFNQGLLLGDLPGVSGGGTLLTASFRAIGVGEGTISPLFNFQNFDGDALLAPPSGDFIGGVPMSFCDGGEGSPCNLVAATVTVLAVPTPPTKVPEPGTVLLLVSGVAISAVGRRRSRRVSAPRP